MLVATGVAVAPRLLVLASVSYTPLATADNTVAQAQRRTARHAVNNLRSLSNRCEKPLRTLRRPRSASGDGLLIGSLKQKERNTAPGTHALR